MEAQDRNPSQFSRCIEVFLRIAEPPDKDMSNQALAYRAMGDATIINANSWLYKDPEKPNTLPQSVLPKGGFYNKNEYKMLSYDFRLAATYNREVNETHILNSYAGAEVNSQGGTQQ